MQLSDVNLDDLDVFERGVPHEWFRLLRREAPVFWHERDGTSGYWAITCHSDLKAINSKEGQEQYERMGLVPKTSTPEALGTFNKEQIAFWEHLVKVSGLKPE